MLKLMKCLKASILIIFLVLLFFNLSCERQDLFKLAEKEATDIISPVPGIITASNIATEGLTLTWAAAVDNISAQPALEYAVYRSNSNNMDTPANIESNGTLIGDWTAGITTSPVDGLIEFTNYFFNVIVRDEAGNMSAYRTSYARTLDGTPPVVTITDPEGEVTLCGPSIFVRATASDNSGVVSKVEFYIDNEKIGEDTEDLETVYEFFFSTELYDPIPPYSTRIISAIAYDEQGNTAENSVSVRLDNTCF